MSAVGARTDCNWLRTHNDVGLGYIRLGQPATTRCGGEAQHIKLASELSRRSTGRTLCRSCEPVAWNGDRDRA